MTTSPKSKKIEPGEVFLGSIEVEAAVIGIPESGAEMLKRLWVFMY